MAAPLGSLRALLHRAASWTMATTAPAPAPSPLHAPKSVVSADAASDTGSDEISARAPTSPQKPSLLGIYCTHEKQLLDRKLSAYAALNADDQAALPEYAERMQALATCVNLNGKFLQTIGDQGAMFLGMPTDEESGTAPTPVTLRTLIDDVCRDWSAAGAAARQAIYKPVLDAVAAAHRDEAAADERPRSGFRVLVTHAGTGRLCWELAREGFSVEGCEAAPARLAASNYLLNHADRTHPHALYPGAHRHTHVRSADEQLTEFSVPDVSAADIGADHGEFGMRVGHFVDLYPADGLPPFDAVVSCLAFELDEHSGAIARAASDALRPGGVWVFLGPMAAPHDDTSIAALLTPPEFQSVVRRAGFKILREHAVDVPVDIHPSTRQRTFHAKLFVALKVRTAK